MTRAVLEGAHHTTQAPLRDVPLYVREYHVRDKIAFYRHTAAVEGGITGAGGFISQPLAVVVIGGLITSTLLTLVLLPVLYTMVESRRERRQARKQNAARPAAAERESVAVG